MSQFRIQIENKDNDKVGYAASKPENIYAIYANFLESSTQIKHVDDNNQYPFCCFGVATIKRTNTDPICILGCLISPNHVMVLASDIVTNLPENYSQTSIIFASFFNLQNESQVQQIYYNKDYDQCNYSVLLLDKPLGQDSGYLGIIAQVSNLEYKYIIAGLDQNQLIYIVQDPTDQNDQAVIFEKKCPLFQGFAINYDLDFGYCIVAIISKESALQIIGEKFNDDKLYNIKRWMLNDHNSSYQKQDNPIQSTYLENCNEIKVQNLIDFNKSKTHDGPIIQIHRLNFESLCSVGQDLTIKIWNLKQGEEIQEFKIDTTVKQISSINSLIFYLKDQCLIFYDFKQQKDIKTISFPLVLTSLCLINEFVVVGDEQGNISFINIESFDIQFQIECFQQDNSKTDLGHSSAISALYTIENENQLAAGDSTGHLKLWDIDNNKVLINFKGHQNDQKILQIIQINKILLSSSMDQTVRFWDLLKGDQIKIINLKSQISSLAKLNSQEILITDSNMVCIFNIKSLQSMYFQRHKTAIQSVAVINSKQFASADQEGIIKLWKIQGTQPASPLKKSSALLQSIPKLKRQQTIDENELFEECLNLKSVVEKQRVEIEELTNENEKLKAEQLFHYVENNIENNKQSQILNNGLSQQQLEETNQTINNLQNQINELNQIINQGNEEKQFFLKKCEEFYQEKEERLKELELLREQEIESFQKIKQKDLFEQQQQFQEQINELKKQIKDRDQLIEEIKNSYIQEQEKINQILQDKDNQINILNLQNQNQQVQLGKISYTQKDQSQFQKQLEILEKENNELQQIILQQKEKLEYFALLHTNLKNENHQMHQQLEHLHLLANKLPTNQTNNSNEYQYLLNQLAQVNQQKTFLQIENDNLKIQLQQALQSKQYYNQETNQYQQQQNQQFKQLINQNDILKTPQRRSQAIQENSLQNKTGQIQTQKNFNQQPQISHFQQTGFNRVARNDYNQPNQGLDNKQQQQMQFCKIDQQIKQRQIYQSLTPDKTQKLADNFQGLNGSNYNAGYFSSRKDDFNNRLISQAKQINGFLESNQAGITAKQSLHQQQYYQQKNQQFI